MGPFRGYEQTTHMIILVGELADLEAKHIRILFDQLSQVCTLPMRPKIV